MTNLTTRWEKELANQVEIATKNVWRRAKTLLAERDEACADLAKAAERVEFLQEKQANAYDVTAHLMRQSALMVRMYQAYWQEKTTLKADLTKVTKQRNEARKERDEARRWKKVALLERDKARHLACKLLTERNVAREALRKDDEDKHGALAAIAKTLAFTKRMIAERNEARRRAEGLHDIAGEVMALYERMMHRIDELKEEAGDA